MAIFLLDGSKTVVKNWLMEEFSGNAFSYWLLALGF